MTEEEFVSELNQVLASHSESVRAKIPPLIASLPDAAQRLDIVIFPAQDGDGFFTIRASVDGPDLYVINKAIDAHAELFDANYTASGVEPPIPIVDPFDVEFPVNDVVVDCTARWLQSVWKSLVSIQCPVPATVNGHDGYGTITPLELHFGA